MLASSADIFGAVESWPQSEATPIRPQSPYGAAKAYGQFLAHVYREAYGLHVSCAILYNHESPLRPEAFVTRKVCLGVARIKLGLQSELALGNLDAQRDWGYAGDFVRAMHLMLQQEKGGDYIIATGKMHTLREFVQRAFATVGLNSEDWVRIDPQFFRPVTEVALVGDPSKAERELGWKAEVDFDHLVELLVKADVEALDGSQTQDGLKLASA
jgi:GDPmannose 4,6-dehydratase